MQTNMQGNKVIEELRASWRDLPGRERGRRLRGLVSDGWKKRAMARELGCSESRVRQLIDSTNQQQNPEIGCRQAAQERRARRKRPLTVPAAQRARLRQEWLKQTVDWIRDFVPHCDRPMFLGEIRKGSCSIRKEQFAKAAPKPDEIHPGADPQQIISDCRPKGENFGDVLEWIEHPIEWFARWAPRVMYDAPLREEVLAEAERILKHEH